jgi:hypothetical protein
MKASRLFSLVGCLAGILTSSLTVPSAAAGTFSTGFESGLPLGTAVFGSAFVDGSGGVNGSGVLKLTTTGNALQGSFIVQDIDGSAPVSAFTATFKMLIGGGNGADGLSFNFANYFPEPPFGEEGAGTGLTVSFDTFDNGGGEAPAIDAKVGGVVVASVPGSGVFRTGDFVDVRIHLDSAGLDVTVNGTAIFANLPVALDLSNAGLFGFGARTGGLNDNHFIDDLTIVTGEPGHPVVTSFSPSSNAARQDAVVRITIQDFVTQVNPASIQLRFDDAVVTPQVSKSGDVTTVQYDPPGLLAAGSSHSVGLTFSDNGSPVFTNTFFYSFIVADNVGPNGNFYEVVLVSSPITWPEAKAAAEERFYQGARGHLATITSVEEDLHLERLRQQNRPAIGQAQLWAGGSQTVPEAAPTENWFWENDEGPIAGFNGGNTYANWLPGEPNDYWGPATENYLAIGLNDAFGWNDDGFLDGGRLGGYIVEYELDGPGIPTVSIEATQWRTAEPCPTCFVAPAVLTIRRTAPTDSGALTVSLQTDGTATSGVDYEALPSTVTIPAGQASVQFNLLPKDDLLVEGPEVVRVRIVPSSAYTIQSYSNEALIVIHDDEPNAPTARIDIISPSNGAHFSFPRPIELSAMAVNLSNQVYNSEFYANGQLIARAHGDATTQPTIPGLPSVHNAVWTNPPVGQHVLTARAELSWNNWVTSPPVNITVESFGRPVVRLETLPAQNAQSPEFCPLNTDCVYGSFVVRRTAPTNEDLRVYLSYTGTATAGADYPQLPNSIVIPAGRDAAFLTLVPTDDSLVEGPETVTARFTPIPGPTYFEDPSASSATITIIDNDTAPPQNVVSIFAEDPIATEFPEITIPEIQPDQARFRIFRTGDLSMQRRVFFSLGGSATSQQDYAILPPASAGSVVIPAGSNSVAFQVLAREDNAAEGMESVLVQLEPSPEMHPLATYDINRAQDFAVAGIFDQGEKRPEVEIVEPREGEHFQSPASVDIIFAAFHPSEFVTAADIFAGSQRIARVFFPIPAPLDGAPIGFVSHRFRWINPPSGTHMLTVRAMHGAESIFATSAPVNITVEGNVVRPTVRIETISPIAEEDTGPLDRLPLRGAFRITRDGPTTNTLPVSVMYLGSATPGSDYETLPMLVTIPAGTNSALLTVSAVPDDLPEGVETVVARVFDCLLVGAPIPCSPFNVDPAHASATVFVVDDPFTEAGLAITRPANGAVFDPGQIILIEATAVDLEGYISRVEFWDGENRIGVSEIVFIVPPNPGTPIHHSFEWRGASSGPHVLTARATRTDGSALKSAPVSITVRGDTPPIMRIEATSPIAEESSTPFRRTPLIGVFTVSRTGPTNEAMSAFVHYSGMATQGVDYPGQGFMVGIPAGATSTEIRIEATPDDLPEGIETVVATLSVCPPPTDPPMGIPCFFVPIDPAHSRATVFIREDGITDATVHITRPTNNAAFNPGQTISIDATAIDLYGYVGYVEFFAGNQKIGSSIINFFVAPPDGTPIQHRFEWRNAPPGQHVLTARAQILPSSPERPTSQIVTSPPVNITVLGEPPGDRELHVVGVYTGTAPGGGTSHNNEQGDAAVIVNRPGKRVTLVLSAYEPVVWHLTVGNATVVDRIILGGYYAQKVEGVGSEVEIIDATFPNNPGNYLYVGYSLDCPDVYRAFEKIRTMTGLEISSFHGGYQAPYPAPIVIDSVQDDPRLRAGYPVPTPASQLPNLQFQLSFHHRGSGGDVFTRRYTLAGPQEDSRLLPATRVIRDGGTRYYYGLNWHDPFRVDTQTGAEQDFVPPASLPELSWPSGLTYDPQRNRVLLVSFGGDGYLYGYAPNTEQWSLVRNMDNRDVESLEYHAAGDVLYGLSVFGGDCSSAWVMKFTSDGQFQSQFRLNLHAYGLSLGSHTTELVSVGEYLVLLLEPTHPHYEQSESRMYLIDPRTGESWLTYRSRGGNPANQPPQITVTRPASGAEFPPDTATIDVDASTHDPDGYVRRVEFFANGLKIGETSMDFILPPPPGQSQTFSFIWRDPAPGSHVLTARAIDDDNASATSAGVPIRVGASNAFPVVNVYAPDSYATEPSSNAVLDTATFRFVRTGPTNSPLPVAFRFLGTAQNGADYESLSAGILIPAGQRSATVTIRPLADNLVEDIESIVVELMPPPPVGFPDFPPVYIIGSRGHAAAVIADAGHSDVARAATCTPVAGALHISFRATAGNYRVEASTDLINWETVSTTSAVNDTVNFVETDRAAFPRRFYRIVPEPMPLAADQ